MRKTSRVEKICTVCEKIGDIGDSVKGSSSRMKNKVGAQKGAYIKMKQENIYIYQWVHVSCYVPIIAPLLRNRLVSVKDLTDCIFNYCILIPLINAFAFYRSKP